ncbi:MAG: hypothetical protein HQM09_15085 [Candidatus Riflebacteria bacterium]|nr:hypothetical protein [Candidatus Riflebacteria bacterium]
MNRRSPSEIREMLTLLREFNIPEETLKTAAINAAREFGISLDGPRVKHETVSEFFEEWKAGNMPLPVCPCHARDLYQAYQLWCVSNKYDSASETGFGRDLNILGIYKIKTRDGSIIDPVGEVGRAFDSLVEAFTKALERYRKSLQKTATR